MGKRRFCYSSSIWPVSNRRESSRTRLKLVLKHNEPLLLHRSRTGLQTNPHFISFTLYWYTALNCQTLYRDVRIKTSAISESTLQRESIQSRGTDSFGVDSPSLRQGSSDLSLEGQSAAEFSSNPDQTHLWFTNDPEDTD